MNEPIDVATTETIIFSDTTRVRCELVMNSIEVHYTIAD